MAKIVIVGLANCPYYARVELIADKLAWSLPNFKLHKTTKLPHEWPEWLAETCRQRGWQHTGSPIIWRELLDRGGKGSLIGGANEFQEYVDRYYDISSSITGEYQMAIASENLNIASVADDEFKERQALIKPLKICITGAASSSVAYSLAGCLARGDTLGHDIDISLHLLDSEPNLPVVQGIEMEARDVAGPMLLETVVTFDRELAFTNCSFIVVADELPIDLKETEQKFLRRMHDHFVDYVAAIEKVAKPDVRVAVVGANSSPVNFIVESMLRSAGALKANQIVAVPQLVENRAKGIIANRLKINSVGVENVIVWGSVNGTHVLDVSRGRLFDYDSAIWGPKPFSVSLQDAVHDDAWLKKDFPRSVNDKGKTVQGMLGHRGGMSVGDAVSKLIRLWWHGAENEQQIHSLAVASEGWYGVPHGLVFSFPVRFLPPSQFTVITDVELTKDIQAKIPVIVDELQSMIETIYPNPERKRVQKSKSRVSLVEASESPVNVISEANELEKTTVSRNSPIRSESNKEEEEEEDDEKDEVTLDKINEEEDDEETER